LNGWRGYFLGANMPVGEGKLLIKEKRPDVVALSVATVLNFDRLNECCC
jgi:MerR family transcriptional regulator, light-induced transcriptional regulator